MISGSEFRGKCQIAVWYREWVPKWIYSLDITSVWFAQLVLLGRMGIMNLFYQGCVLHTSSVLFEGTVVTNNASMMLCWNNMFIHNHVAKICPNFLMSLFPIETCAGVGSYEGSCVSVWRGLGKLGWMIWWRSVKWWWEAIL